MVWGENGRLAASETTIQINRRWLRHFSGRIGFVFLNQTCREAQGQYAAFSPMAQHPGLVNEGENGAPWGGAGCRPCATVDLSLLHGVVCR